MQTNELKKTCLFHLFSEPDAEVDGEAGATIDFQTWTEEEAEAVLQREVPTEFQTVVWIHAAVVILCWQLAWVYGHAGFCTKIEGVFIILQWVIMNIVGVDGNRSGRTVVNRGVCVCININDVASGADAEIVSTVEAPACCGVEGTVSIKA